MQAVKKLTAARSVKRKEVPGDNPDRHPKIDAENRGPDPGGGESRLVSSTVLPVPTSRRPIVASDVRPMGDGQAFRPYHYVTVQASLKLDGEEDSITADTGNTMSLIDEQFLARMNPDATIHEFEGPLFVRGVGEALTPSSRYAIVDIFMKSLDGPIVKFSCEVHIVQRLSANLLLGLDVIEPQSIIVDAKSQQIRIGSCQNLPIKANVFFQNSATESDPCQN